MTILAFIAAFFILVGILTTIVLAYDCYYKLKNTCRRRKIGDFKSQESWKSIVDLCTLACYRKMPAVTSGGDHRLILIHKILNAKHKKSVQMWQTGGILLGIAALLKYKKNDVLYADIEKSICEKYMKDQKWLRQKGKIDNVLIAYALLKMPFYRDLYKPVMDKVVDSILYNLQEDGTIAYRKENTDIRLVDTIGIICPFLTLYGVLYNRKDMMELALKQISEHVKYAVFQDCFLPAHAYGVRLKIPYAYGWGRGIGWLALGLIDTYCELPKDHPGKVELKEWIYRLSDAIKSFQLRNGGWSCSWVTMESHFDSSVTSMLAYFLKKSIIQGLIPEGIYGPLTLKGEEMLKKATRSDGTIDFSQGDTKDIGCYSHLFAPMPFTQGMTTLLLNI